MHPVQVLLLENTRFHAGECKNDSIFAQEVCASTIAPLLHSPPGSYQARRFLACGRAASTCSPRSFPDLHSG